MCATSLAMFISRVTSSEWITPPIQGVCAKMRIRMNDSRKRKLEDLKMALDENAGSKALFAAAEYTIRMRGETTAVPQGQIAALLELAEKKGSVTAAEIAKVLDTNIVGVEYESVWSVESE